jgi:hypothetical protein
MTDLELLEILERPASNLEKALAIRTLLKVAQPSAFSIKPQVERKKRAANKTKFVTAAHFNGLGSSPAVNDAHVDAEVKDAH